MNDETAGPAVKVVFTPSGKRGTFPVGTNLLQAARDLGVDLDSVCGGRGICGRCQITISKGRFAKFGIESTADHLSAFSANEHRYKNRRGMADGRRLGCHATVQGRSGDRCPAGQPGPQAGRAQAGRSPRYHDQPCGPPALCRGREARHASPDRRFRAAGGGAAGPVGPRRARRRHPDPARVAENSARRRLDGDRCNSPE